jgi:hypothetical protein
MLALAHRYDELFRSPSGTYRARVFGEAGDDGMWNGWLVFFPVAGGRAIATDRETTQPSLADLTYWASGLTPVYLEGALRRALELQPELQLGRELDELERLEAATAIRAETLESAADLARTESRLAGAARDRAEDRFLGAVAATSKAEAAAHEHAAAAARNTAAAAEKARRPRAGSKSSKKK